MHRTIHKGERIARDGQNGFSTKKEEYRDRPASTAKDESHFFPIRHMLNRVISSAAEKARILNVAMLVVGYGAGQGSVFLAQTWLIAEHRLRLLALFGTHFSFAIFGILLVEGGSLITLARHSAEIMAQELEQPCRERMMWRKLWEVSAFRIALALTIVFLIFCGVASGLFDDFSQNYALCAAPAFLIWAFSATGCLDGLKLSGISGISGSVAYVVSAIALFFVRNMPISLSGVVLGCAFTIGFFLTVCVQYAALYFAGWKLRFERPTRIGIITAARDGTMLLGSTLPGQFYFRGQLLLSSVLLGQNATAILVYVKQLIAAAAQLIGFIRRVEFPNLVNRLRSGSRSPLETIMRTQRLGTWLSVAIALVTCVAGISLNFINTGLPRDLGVYLPMFAITIVTSSIVLALGQGLSALGMYSSLFVRSIASTAVGLAFSFVLIVPLGIVGILIADVFSALVGGIVLVISFKRKN